MKSRLGLVSPFFLQTWVDMQKKSKPGPASAKIQPADWILLDFRPEQISWNRNIIKISKFMIKFYAIEWKEVSLYFFKSESKRSVP